MEPASRGIALALGGGGARGFAHVGVFRVLERSGTPVRAIAGTSAGAVLGALWASGMDAERVAEVARRMRRWRLLVPSLRGRSILSDGGVRRVLRPFLEGRRFVDLRVPLAIRAADLETGEPVTIREGELLSAVIAAAAVPAVFPPARREGRVLVDGGIVGQVPVSAARELRGGPVVAVDLGFLALRRERYDGSLWAVAERALDILGKRVAREELATADLVLRPDVERFTVRDWGEADKYIEAGERETEARLPEIRRLLENG